MIIPTCTSLNTKGEGMNQPKRWALLVVAALALLLAPAQAALALPPLPYSPWGLVTSGGVAAPNGVRVTAWADGAQIATTLTVGGGWYTLDIPGDDADTPEKDGLTPGEVITFKAGRQLATETGTWASGMSPRIDLTLEIMPEPAGLLRLPLVLRGWPG